MVNYLAATKLVDEIEKLTKQKQKNYCFILAENSEDEAAQILENDREGTIFIIVRKDRWQQEKPDREL